jgi:hypothetical protein
MTALERYARPALIVAPGETTIVFLKTILLAFVFQWGFSSNR